MAWLKYIAIFMVFLGVSLAGIPVHACDHHEASTSIDHTNLQPVKHAQSQTISHEEQDKDAGHHNNSKHCLCCGGSIAFLDASFSIPSASVMAHHPSIAEEHLAFPQLLLSQDRPPKYF